MSTAPSAIADPTVGADWNPMMARRWWQALPEDLSMAERTARAGQLFMLLDALGLALGGEGWDLLLSGPLINKMEVPSVAIRYSLREAAQQRRVGDTVLLMLMTLGEAGPRAASPLALGSAVRTLRAVGLDAEARALAVEAIVEGGL